MKYCHWFDTERRVDEPQIFGPLVSRASTWSGIGHEVQKGGDNLIRPTLAEGMDFNGWYDSKLSPSPRFRLHPRR